MNFDLETIQLDLPDEPPLTMLVAFDRQTLKVIGMVTVKSSASTVVEFNRLWVAPSHRRQKIGSALLFRVEQSVKQSGAEAVSCIVRQKNAAAHAFYRSLGYFHAVVFQDGNDLWTKKL